MLEVRMHPNYAKNSEKCGDQMPCCACGKRIEREKVKHWLHLSIWWEALTPDEAKAAVESGDSQGCWPIGADCLRKQPELRPYLLK